MLPSDPTARQAGARHRGWLAAAAWPTCSPRAAGRGRSKRAGGSVLRPSRAPLLHLAGVHDSGCRQLAWREAILPAMTITAVVGRLPCDSHAVADLRHGWEGMTIGDMRGQHADVAFFCPCECPKGHPARLRAPPPAPVATALVPPLLVCDRWRFFQLLRNTHGALRLLPLLT